MQKTPFLPMILLALFALGSIAIADDRPNIVLIVVDDMGFSDLGCYGGEIETPNLDRLAENGLRFTQFYNTARCWSTRCSLMTGFYPQQIRMDPYRGGVRLPDWSPTLPHYLKQLGYRCYHSGKWHVNGAPKVVADGAFDRSYHLQDHDRNFNPQQHEIDDHKAEAVKPDSGYYTTCAITDHTLEQLTEHAKEHSDKPFFAFTAYTVPHFPLHAPPEDIEKYRDRYLEGWDSIRKQRHERLRQLGIVNCGLSAREDTNGPPYRFENVPGNLGDGEVLFPLAWDTLTDEQKRFQATKMAIHAAMVDRMDQEVGRIVEKIRDMSAWDNTILFFLSDNGASAEVMIRGDMHDPNAAPGSAASYLCLGPGWATAANTPFRRHKVWNHEGGISTPMIVHWPNGIAKPGTLRHDQGHVIDFVPTVLELVGLEPAKQVRDESPGFPGMSLLPAITSDREQGQKHDDQSVIDRESLYFSHEGNAALRMGDWKITYTKTGEEKGHVPAEQSKDTNGWSLYHLADDRCEQIDLAEQTPERLAEMVAKWKALHQSFKEQAKE